MVRVLDRIFVLGRLADITPHTLRHAFTSVAGDLGSSGLAIAALLGHSARGTTQRYVHIDEALRLTANRVADEIHDTLASGRTRLDRRVNMPVQRSVESGS